jgi:hypothetical protein
MVRRILRFFFSRILGMNVYSEALGMSQPGGDGTVVTQESYLSKLQSAFGGMAIGQYALPDCLRIFHSKDFMPQAQLS